MDVTGLRIDNIGSSDKSQPGERIKLKSKIIDWRTAPPDLASLQEIKDIFRSGGNIVFPTETVFGLGANALSDNACSKVFLTKKRPGDNPLIVHVSSFEMVERIAELDQELKEKLTMVWPGPLTVILKNIGVSKIATSGLDTVGIRMPLHRQARKMIEFAGIPIAAPSANMASRPSITRNSDALREFNGKVDAIILGDEPEFGLESTVIDPYSSPAKILRSGSYTAQELEPVFGKLELYSGNQEHPTTPGMKYRHYSPVKPLYLVENILEFKKVVSRSEDNVVPICSEEVGESLDRYFISLGSQYDLRSVARNLFAAFNAFDQSNYDSAFIHGFQEEGLGITIMNRIRKASSEL